MLWRLASAWGDSPPRNSCTTWRLNSIECVRCLAMGFLLESPVQLADSQGPYLSTPKGALQIERKFGPRYTIPNRLGSIITTNHQHAVTLGIGDRRYFVVEADERYASDQAYF